MHYNTVLSAPLMYSILWIFLGVPFLKLFYFYFFLVFLIKCIPDCPGGGNPDGPLGRHKSTVRTAALPPEHGSKAIGLGGAFKERKWGENALDIKLQ